MAIWDNVRQGIDKAGKLVEHAVDEGKVRLDAKRARDRADRAAQALGYACFQAWEASRELDGDVLRRLVTALRDADTDAARAEQGVRDATAARRGG
jgi:hypothetical protein